MKFLFPLFLPILAGAAVLPDSIGPYQRSEVSAPTVADRPLWDEYGLKSSESAVYLNGPGRLVVSVWRLQDSTAAMAAFDWQRPAAAKPSSLAALAAETPKAVLLVHGNFLLSLVGYKPTAEELTAVYAVLPDADPSPPHA